MQRAGQVRPGVERRAESRSALIVMNPSEDRCSPGEIRSQLAEALVPNGWSLEVTEVKSGSELAEAVGRARHNGHDMVVVAGGDGTVALAARHLAGSDVLMAIIPAGEANSLSEDLGIPQDTAKAAALLTSEHEVGYLDALRVENTHYFLQVGTAAPLPADATPGDSVWDKAGTRSISQLSGFHSQRFSLEVDGAHSRASGWQVIVVNTGSLRSPLFQSGMPNRPSDHQAELVVLRVRGGWDLIRAALHLLNGDRDSGVSITYQQVHEKAVIVPDDPMPVQGDGQPIGTTPIEVIVVPKAVRVVVPGEVAAAPTESQRKRRREGRRFRRALLRGLSPLGALDTALYLAVSRLPHPRLLNLFMQSIEVSMASGQGWIAGILAANVRHWQKIWREEASVAPLIWLTSATTEFPIKRVFARPRPFVSLVLAPVIGRKPSSHSFPSGHSASAFAGAWLLSKRHPRWAPAFYAFASLVAFSRVYQGAHYPSDVLIGAGVGTSLAATYRWALGTVLRNLSSRLPGKLL